MRKRKCKVFDDFFADKGNIKSVYEDRKKFKNVAPHFIDAFKKSTLLSSIFIFTSSFNLKLPTSEKIKFNEMNTRNYFLDLTVNFFYLVPLYLHLKSVPSNFVVNTVLYWYCVCYEI